MVYCISSCDHLSDWEVDATITFVFQLRKLRHCRLPRVTQQSQDLIPSRLTLELLGKPLLLLGLGLLICELWA